METVGGNVIRGGTSTGSKRADLVFGPDWDGPTHMLRSRGARVWAEGDVEFVDFSMALGAVALGYAHPAVTQAATRAVVDGGVSGIAPAEEVRLAARLIEHINFIDSVRFLKTGAEAVAASVRIARVHTGRERVVRCGYQGWL